MAGRRDSEPAASCVTGGRSNQLNYAPALKPQFLNLLLRVDVGGVDEIATGFAKRVVHFSRLVFGRTPTPLLAEGQWCLRRLRKLEGHSYQVTYISCFLSFQLGIRTRSRLLFRSGRYGTLNSPPDLKLAAVT